MKALKLTLIFVALASISGVAQFRTEIGGMVGGHGVSKGFGLYLSPSYKFGRFAAGLRGEFLVIAPSRTTDPNFISQVSINGQYYFIEGDVSAFVGLGAGFYNAGTGGMLCDCSVQMKGNPFGMYPRAGLEYGHLIIAIEFNIITRIRTVSTSDMPGYYSSSTEYTNINYLDAKIGVLIGGGKRKKI